MISSMRVVDLTQPLDATTVMWPGAPQPTAETILTVAHDGFYNRKISFMEHSGTHFDAPCHMVESTKSVDEIAADRLVRPLAMIDISPACAGQPDAILTLDQVHDFEARHGRIPDDAAVFLRTGWEDFNTDPARYAGAPAAPLPGFGPDAARFLVEERAVAGLGVDTLGIDPGSLRLRRPSPDQPPTRRLAPREPRTSATCRHSGRGSWSACSSSSMAPAARPG
jgi:kynurenine formamidase